MTRIVGLWDADAERADEFIIYSDPKMATTLAVAMAISRSPLNRGRWRFQLGFCQAALIILSFSATGRLASRTLSRLRICVQPPQHPLVSNDAQAQEGMVDSTQNALHGQRNLHFGNRQHPRRRLRARLCFGGSFFFFACEATRLLAHRRNRHLQLATSTDFGISLPKLRAKL